MLLITKWENLKISKNHVSWAFICWKILLYYEANLIDVIKIIMKFEVWKIISGQKNRMSFDFFLKYA